MVITKELRKKLKRLLPQNYRQIIAEQCGCHPNTVGNVLNGSHNADVALAILELAMKHTKQNEQVREKARAIAEQL